MAYIESGDAVEQKHFDFLEKLRQSGKTNMWGAAAYLKRAFPRDFKGGRIGEHAASKVLLKWMAAHRQAGRGQ